MKKRGLTKKIVCTVFVAVFAALFVALLSGCGIKAFQDKSFKDEDYIEVESLRIDKAQIFMAPEGEPSTYQINATTYPTNATNKQMSYYISTEYHQYLTVSETGLLTAHAVSNGIAVPVTVRSTTNTKATLKLSVTIEEVEVKEVRFAQDKIELLYNGDSAQIGLVYEPAHAINGRNPYFTSLDESVATVSSTGVVRPVGAGNTTIKVSCPRRGESVDSADGVKVQNFIKVNVSYAKGQYQLSVSGSPSFRQVVGSPTPIDFTLLILGDNVDPSPKIVWRVGNERIGSVQDSTQYTHVPDATTDITYYITAEVTPYHGTPVLLRSDLISIYRAFSGVELTYGNLSDTYKGYRYGDEVTFSLGAGGVVSTVVGYDWYLAHAEDPANELLIAHTSTANKDLTRRMNVAGDYALTAKAVDASGYTVSQSKFYFSSEKFVTDDVLIVKPEPVEYGLPPDSYHYYVVPCDEEGNYDETEKTLYKDTSSEETLYMPLTTAGAFRFLVTASIGGVAATVSQNGQQAPYMYVSDVLRVYEKGNADVKRNNDLVDVEDVRLTTFFPREYASVESLRIEGIGRTGYEVYLKWNSIGENPSYEVEITKEDGSVVILDSAEKEARFGSNYCYVPRSVVTLSDKFSVRVKQKGGLYSERYAYGEANASGTADETHVLTYDAALYPFFATIGYNNTAAALTSINETTMSAPALNAYLTDEEELALLTEFILLYRPENNTYVKKVTSGKLVEQAYYDTFTLKAYFAFTIPEDFESRYPHGLSAERLESYGDFAPLAKMIYGVARAYAYGFDFLLEIEEEVRGVTLEFAVPSLMETELKAGTATNSYESVDTLAYSLPDEDEPVDLNNLPVDLKDGVYVYDSEELLFALESGYRPIPQGSDALADLYRLIKTVAVRVADPFAPTKEILRAFYEYLALHVYPDPDVGEWSARAVTAQDLFLYEEMRLEGGFGANAVAASAGIAKAYAALCGVYGIPCRVISGMVLGQTHYFNKVYVEDEWYVVDVTKATYVLDGYLTVSGNYFMISDERYATYLDTRTYKTTIYGGVPVSVTDVGTETAVVGTTAQLKEELSALVTREKGVYGVEIDFLKMGFIATESIEEALESIGDEMAARGLSVGSTVAVTYSDNRITRVIVLVEVL